MICAMRVKSILVCEIARRLKVKQRNLSRNGDVHFACRRGNGIPLPFCKLTH